MRIRSPLPHKKTRIEIIPLIDIMFFLLASFMMVSLQMQKVQTLRANLNRPVLEGIPQTMIRGGFRDFPSLGHGPNVLPRTTDQKRQAITVMDLGNGLVSSLLKHRQTPGFIRSSYIDQVMRHAGQFGWRGFGGANIQATIEKAGIGGDDFAAEAFGQLQSRFSLPNGCWPNNNNQR